MDITKKNFSLYRAILSTEFWEHKDISESANIKSWLLEEGSLTQKLQSICQKLEVEIINQHWVSEKKEQKITAIFDTFWLREVLLKGDGEDWIFAQTKFSQSIMEKREKDIMMLGTEPLGLWLFSQKPKRINLEWYQDPETSLYARRSLLSLNEDYMEISELFLDKFHFIQQN